MTAHSPMKSLNVSRTNKGKYRSRGEQMARMWEQFIKDGPGADIILGGQYGLKIASWTGRWKLSGFLFPWPKRRTETMDRSMIYVSIAKWSYDVC